MSVKFPKSEKYNFNRNLVKNHKLVTHLDQYLGTEIKEFRFEYEPKKHDKGFHPSGHCTMSAAELFAVISNDPEPKDWGVAMLKTFMVGHFWHQLLQKAVLDIGLAEPEAIEVVGYKDWGRHLPQGVANWSTPDGSPEGRPLAQDEYRKEDLYYLKYPEQRALLDAGKDPATFLKEGTWVDGTRPGHLIRTKDWHYATGAGDIAPCSIPDYGDYVVDFKTMSAQQYRQPGVPGWAAEKYEAQINMYMDFFDIDQALIVAICKDSPHDMKEFEYVRNQPLIDMVYEKWKFVSDCLDDNHCPDEQDEADLSLEGLFTGPIVQ